MSHWVRDLVRLLDYGEVTLHKSAGGLMGLTINGEQVWDEDLEGAVTSALIVQSNRAEDRKYVADQAAG